MTKYLIIILALAYQLPALSCSYIIDEQKVSSEFILEVEKTLEGEQIISSSVADFKVWESKPTSMCPEELTYQGVVSITYREKNIFCNVTVQVTKVEPFGSPYSTESKFSLGPISETCK